MSVASAVVEKIICRLQKSCPKLKREVLTKTACGRPVELLRFGEGKRRVLLTAGHHANETITSLLLLYLLEDYCREVEQDGKLWGLSCGELYARTYLYVVPLVNPDGADLTAGTASAEEVRAAKKLAKTQPQVPFPQGWKANLQGVDLNLNYPARWELAKTLKAPCAGPRDFPGHRPLDQRETAALAALTKRISPHVMAAWHTQGGEIYGGEDDALLRRLSQVSGYQAAQVPPESNNAGFRDWFLQEFDRPAFTIEAGRGENPLPLSDLPRLYAENLPIFMLLLAGGENEIL